MMKFPWYMLFASQDTATQTYKEQYAIKGYHILLTIGMIFIVMPICGRLVNLIVYHYCCRCIDTKSINKLLTIKILITNVTSLISWCGFFILANIPAVWWGFNLISFCCSVTVSICIMSLRLVWAILYENINKFRVFLIVFLITVYSFAIAFLLQGVSQVTSDDRYGWFNNQISTSLIRRVQLPTMCAPGPPCHVYATLAEDAETTVFVNIQTSLLHSNILVCWYPLITTEAKKQQQSNHNSCSKAERFKFDDHYIENNAKRYIHSIYISNLSPDTLYEIQIFYADSNVNLLSEVYDFPPMDYHFNVDSYLAVIERYRTLPDLASNRTIRIAMGGDAGVNENSRNMSSQVAKYKPDVIVIGGDVTYDNGLRTSYYVWDQFLDMLNRIYDSKGYLIPLILTIGNHDVGKDTLSTGVVSTSKEEDCPLWFLYFPQHSGKNLSQIPKVVERKTYFYKKFGKFIFVSLDSGYQESMTGYQLNWWKHINNRYFNQIKILSYHNPIYWSSDYPDQIIDKLEWNQTQQGIKFWIPEIDRANYYTVLENHIHTFKRTFPLRAGKVDMKNGTVYLGDGSWGAAPNETSIYNETGILAMFNSAINQAFIVDLDSISNLIIYQVINSAGILIDKSEQNFIYNEL